MPFINRSVQETTNKPQFQIPEYCIPLYRVGTESTYAPNEYSLIAKGSTSIYNTTITPGKKLYTHGYNWSPAQRFAFQVMMRTDQTGATAFAKLVNLTTGVPVDVVELSAVSYNPIVLRSGVINLIPGNVYGVMVTHSGAGVATYFHQADIVVLGG